MSLYLYGIIEQTKTIDFGPIGFKGGRVFSLPAGDIAAVVGPPPAEVFAKLHKELLIAFLLAHQQTLEGVMKQYFVIPFKFGTVVGGEEELAGLLKKEKSFFAGLLNRMKDCTEIDLIATWEVTRMLQEISEEDAEVIALKKEMARKNQPQRGVEGEAPSGFARGGGDASPQNADPVLIGMALANALKQRAAGWSEKIKGGLKGYSVASADHDLLNDTMVLNSSFLIHRDRGEEFNRALEELDACFGNKLRFKCVGPLPPYSFATVAIKRFDPLRMEEAAKVLRLNGRAELSAVKRIYKELSRECHPDAHPDLPPENFEQLNQAYELVADYCKDEPRSLKREDVERCTRLEIAEPREPRSHAA